MTKAVVAIAWAWWARCQEAWGCGGGGVHALGLDQHAGLICVCFKWIYLIVYKLD